MRKLLFSIFILCSFIFNVHAQKSDAIYKVVDVKPVFQYICCNNTNDCILEYFKTHAKWPTDDDIQGTIYIQCVVEKNGKLSTFKVIRGLDPRYDSVSVHVLKAMPVWKPGKKNGKIVRTEIVVPARWQLY